MAFVALFREMWRYAGAGRWKIVTYVVLHFAASLGYLATPLVFAQVLNSLQTAPNTEVMIREVAQWTLAWAAFAQLKDQPGALRDLWTRYVATAAAPGVAPAGS